MKAITLTQPWATLVAIGAKKIETRSWSTNYRGPLAIHAAKTFGVWGESGLKSMFRQYPQFEKALSSKEGWSLKQLPRSAIVGTCNLIDCIRITNKREVYGYVISMGYNVVVPPDEPEFSFGDYTPGRFAWLLADIQELAAPVQARGSLGLWTCAL